jgi:hypothetical protein
VKALDVFCENPRGIIFARASQQGFGMGGDSLVRMEGFFTAEVAEIPDTSGQAAESSVGCIVLSFAKVLIQRFNFLSSVMTFLNIVSVPSSDFSLALPGTAGTISPLLWVESAHERTTRAADSTRISRMAIRNPLSFDQNGGIVNIPGVATFCFSTRCWKMKSCGLTKRPRATESSNAG